MWTFGSDVTGDAAVMTNGQASFVGIFFTVFVDLRLAFSQIILPFLLHVSYAEENI
jgi:hypothetical protein